MFRRHGHIECHQHTVAVERDAKKGNLIVFGELVVYRCKDDQHARIIYLKEYGGERCHVCCHLVQGSHYI